MVRSLFQIGLSSTLTRHRDTLAAVPPDLPSLVPEVPVARIDTAVAYYANCLGFELDWGSDDGGIAGISQGSCRLFLTNAEFRQSSPLRPPVIVWLNLSSRWLNLSSRQEVDRLFARWQSAGAHVLSPPEDKPWNLREFTIADPDANRLRVFYDFNWELQERP